LIHGRLNDANCPISGTRCPRTANQIYIDRRLAGAPNETITEIFYQVVEFKDNTAVLSNLNDTQSSDTMSAAALSFAVTLEHEVDPSRSIAFGQGQFG